MLHSVFAMTLPLESYLYVHHLYLNSHGLWALLMATNLVIPKVFSRGLGGGGMWFLKIYQKITKMVLIYLLKKRVSPSPSGLPPQFQKCIAWTTSALWILNYTCNFFLFILEKLFICLLKIEKFPQSLGYCKLST